MAVSSAILMAGIEVRVVVHTSATDQSETAHEPATGGAEERVKNFGNCADHSASNSSRPSELRPYDPSDLIVFEEQVSIPPPALKSLYGIGGNATELHQNLHACLSVGRYDRAASIVRKLEELFMPTAPDLVEAHTVYVRALADAILSGSLDAAAGTKRIHYWFETQIRAKGVTMRGDIVANACRAALGIRDEGSKVRALRRYMHLAEKHGVLDDTLASGEISEEEWEELLELRHQFLPEQILKKLPATLSQEEMLDGRSEDAIQVSSGQESNPDSELMSPPSPRKEPDWMHVKPVEQKGTSVSALKESLVSIYNIDSVPYPDHIRGTKEEKDRAWAELRQQKLEEDVVDVALAQWKEQYENMLKMGINKSIKGRKMDALLWQWQHALEKSIQEELALVREALKVERCRVADHGHRSTYGPYLEAVATEKLAGITILSMTQSIVRNIDEGSKVARLASKIGSFVEREAKYQGFCGNNTRHARKQDLLAKRRQKLRLAQGSAVASLEMPELAKIRKYQWPTQVKLHIGAILISKLVEVATIPARAKEAGADAAPTLVPAFKHSIEYEKGKKVGKIRAHEQLVQKLMHEPSKSSVGLSGLMPMLVEPKPWKSLSNGPYYRYSPPFMRKEGSDTIQAMYAEAASEKGDLAQFFAGLDVLGKTPWKINDDVLRVMLDAWNRGEAIAKIPAERPDLVFPEEPPPSVEPAERRKWRREVRKVENEQSGLHSQRCFLNLQLEVAKAYVGKTFYYPHNIDFRGRAYPVPPFLNHLGADSARGLLVFGVSKPLGETGLKWLKIHLANLTGFDKASLEEREQFVMDHLDDIRDSATKPLDGRRWWLEAEDPWQCLAACFELTAAMDSPDPTQFVSRIPVAQDGSCNGLQHYAALGGDTFGATQVNLAPGSRPADVYSGVAKLVREAIQEDADDGNPIAKVMVNKITRKVVKQTVMTNVYGVTFVGARAQVQKQLDEIMKDRSEIDVSNWVLASYVAKKVFKALATMFEGAHGIQYWLAECADRITRAITPEQIRLITSQKRGQVPNLEGQYRDKAWKYWAKKNDNEGEVKGVDFRTTVIWTTPLKLPVVQPYRAPKYREFITCLQHVRFVEPRNYDPVNRRRQVQAFPPNFVHSLDATHMMLSALKCHEHGLTFAAVHDSFWTHACDIPVMSTILRQAFIKMHSEDIVGRLASEFKARYKGSLQLATVYVRSPLGQRILAMRTKRASASAKRSVHERKGTTLQAKSVQNELLEEYERQQLLASEDLDQRAKGEAMETPGALYSQASEADFLVPTILDDSVDRATATETAQDSDVNRPFAANTEDPAATEAGHEDLESDDPNSIEGEEVGASVFNKLAKRLNRKSAEAKIVVWAPLVFPKVPPKGDFDVTQVAESRYFFA